MSEQAFGWGVEQILVYIWQCCSSGQTEQEYPYKKFSDSKAGKRLRLELEALATKKNRKSSHAIGTQKHYEEKPKEFYHD